MRDRDERIVWVLGGEAVKGGIAFPDLFSGLGGPVLGVRSWTRLALKKNRNPWYTHMSSVIRAPQQRLTKSLVALGGIGANNGGVVHGKDAFFAALEYVSAVAVSASLYTVASNDKLNELLVRLRTNGDNRTVDRGNVATDMGKTVNVQVAGSSPASAEFQLVAVDTAEDNELPPISGYANTRIVRADNMDQSDGLTYFARI